jgi:hypothetical protein
MASSVARQCSNKPGTMPYGVEILAVAMQSGLKEG